jgi:hypothetical protein
VHGVKYILGMNDLTCFKSSTKQLIKVDLPSLCDGGSLDQEKDEAVPGESLLGRAMAARS